MTIGRAFGMFVFTSSFVMQHNTSIRVLDLLTTNMFGLYEQSKHVISRLGRKLFLTRKCQTFDRQEALCSWHISPNRHIIILCYPVPPDGLQEYQLEFLIGSITKKIFSRKVHRPFRCSSSRGVIFCGPAGCLESLEWRTDLKTRNVAPCGGNEEILISSQWAFDDGLL